NPSLVITITPLLRHLRGKNEEEKKKRSATAFSARWSRGTPLGAVSVIHSGRLHCSGGARGASFARLPLGALSAGRLAARRADRRSVGRGGGQNCSVAYSVTLAPLRRPVTGDAAREGRVDSSERPAPPQRSQQARAAAPLWLRLALLAALLAAAVAAQQHRRGARGLWGDEDEDEDLDAVGGEDEDYAEDDAGGGGGDSAAELEDALWEREAGMAASARRNVAFMQGYSDLRERVPKAPASVLDEIDYSLRAGDLLLPEAAFMQKLNFSRAVQRSLSDLRVPCEGDADADCVMTLPVVRRVLSRSGDAAQQLRAWRGAQAALRPLAGAFPAQLALARAAAAANGVAPAEGEDGEGEDEDGAEGAGAVGAYWVRLLDPDDFLDMTALADLVYPSARLRALDHALDEKGLKGRALYETALETLNASLGIEGLPSEDLLKQVRYDGECPTRFVQNCSSASSRLAHEHLGAAEDKRNLIRVATRYSATHDMLASVIRLLSLHPDRLEEVGALPDEEDYEELSAAAAEASGSEDDDEVHRGEATLRLLVALRTLPRLAYLAVFRPFRLRLMAALATTAHPPPRPHPRPRPRTPPATMPPPPPPRPAPQPPRPSTPWRSGPKVLMQLGRAQRWPEMLNDQLDINEIRAEPLLRYFKPLARLLTVEAAAKAAPAAKREAVDLTPPALPGATGRTPRTSAPNADKPGAARRRRREAADGAATTDVPAAPAQPSTNGRPPAHVVGAAGQRRGNGVLTAVARVLARCWAAPFVAVARGLLTKRRYQRNRRPDADAPPKAANGDVEAAAAAVPEEAEPAIPDANQAEIVNVIIV
ncbi:LOW QUALITY PROTEIN: Angiotensin-converting enzyme, partial [Gryllus bimaculatus]